MIIYIYLITPKAKSKECREKYTGCKTLLPFLYGYFTPVSGS
jgi:hypothetical protein